MNIFNFLARFNLSDLILRIFPIDHNSCPKNSDLTCDHGRKIKTSQMLNDEVVQDLRTEIF